MMQSPGKRSSMADEALQLIIHLERELAELNRDVAAGSIPDEEAEDIRVSAIRTIARLEAIPGVRLLRERKVV